jgi:hypothetical protein
MRRRSGGVHCQTYEELIDVKNAAYLQIINPNSSALSHCHDIESFLVEQQQEQPRFTEI